MADSSAQEYLFQRIKDILPQQVSMVDAISDILHVSNDSAYRRIRGETPLVLEEAKQLCDHFKFSLDQLLSVKAGFTLFQTERIHYKNYTFEKYLGGILQQLQALTGFMRKEIIYLTKDIPIFHNFLLRPLFAFRYFFWMKSILRHPEFENRHFTLDCLTPEIEQLGADIIKAYNSVSSTEIWNTECANSIVFQVEYYREAGFFSSPSDSKVVYDAVEGTLNHLKEQAEYGCKFLPGENPELKKTNFKFFYNRATLGDNTIIAVTESFKAVFLNYDVMNYMLTRDEAFCNDSYEDLQALIRRSALISSTGEKQRNIFFKILTGKIQERKRHL
jgi:hypothetical protein